jgi:hypothetical protein
MLRILIVILLIFLVSHEVRSLECKESKEWVPYYRESFNYTKSNHESPLLFHLFKFYGRLGRL